jgi:carbon-monoxide dehydrogenase large subunit
VREVLLDRLARRLGQDPAALRRRNLLGPDELPFRTPTGAVYDSGEYARGLDLALYRLGYEEIRARQEAWWQDGRHVGAGISCYVEFTGTRPRRSSAGAAGRSAPTRA